MDWLFIFQCLYYFLPAYVANMTPVFVRKLPFLHHPIWSRKLGPHKTWRGLLLGTLAGTIVFGLQRQAYLMGFTSLALLDYADFSLGYGISMAGGALLGDVIKSYYKRKAQIPPGKSWIPWDQLDFVLGGIAGVAFLYAMNITVVLILVLASPALHVLVNYLGYLLGMKENKW